MQVSKSKLRYSSRITTYSKLNIHSLALVLLSHSSSTVISDLTVPRSSNVNTGRENAVVVSVSDTSRAVLQTERAEGEARDSYKKKKRISIQASTS